MIIGEGLDTIFHFVSRGWHLNEPVDARSAISRRNPLRLWLAPFTAEHRSVWVGRISRDIGVKLTTMSGYLTTHRISPYVDQERDYLLQDLLLTGFVERWERPASIAGSP